MTKKDNEDLETLLNVGSVIMIMLIMMRSLWWDQLRDHCHISVKYRGSAHRDCNNNVKSQNFCLFSQSKKSYDLQLLCKN